MIIGDDGVRREIARRQLPLRVGHVAGGHHVATPARQQHAHAVENARLVIQRQHDHSRERLMVLRAHMPAGDQSARQHALADGGVNAKHRPLAGLRGQPHAMPHNAAEALDDGQAKAEAGRCFGRWREALELAEHILLFGFRNAKARIPNLDHKIGRTPAAAHQHAALGGVFERVRNQVLQQPPQHPPIRAHAQRARRKDQLQPPFFRHWLELDAQLTQQIVDAERAGLSRHGARVKT